MKRGRRSGASVGQTELFDTSRAANKAIKDDKPRLQDMVFDFIHNRGPYGATCDEVERALGMRHQTASARVRELSLASRVKIDGTRKTSSGRPARVYVSVGEQDGKARSADNSGSSTTQGG